MSFENEKEMYPAIAEWLCARDQNPCARTEIDKVRFKFGTKMNRADVVGVYQKDGHSHLVGVEAKNKATTHQTALRQAQALQALCHEVYVAFPKKSYHRLDQREKDEVESILSRSHIGLLLVKKRSPDKIEVIVPTHTSIFSLDLYENAINEFKCVTTDDGRTILKELQGLEQDKFNFLKDEWELFKYKEGVYFEHTVKDEDDDDLFIGGIKLDSDSVTLTVDIDSTIFAAALGMPDTCEVLSYSFANPYDRHIHHFTYKEPLEIVFKDEKVSNLSVFGDDFQGPISILRILLSNEIWSFTLRHSIARPCIIDVENSKELESLVNAVAHAYSVVYKLGMAICDV